MYSQIDSNKRKTLVLISAFIAVIIACGWAFAQYTNTGYPALVVAALISCGSALFGYYQGDKVALMTAGARAITKEENPYVYRLVENLCLTAGLPLPKIHLIDDSAINAFACGRSPEHASIAITTGAVEKLENEELEGVIAHELGHIQNYDIRLMTVIIVLVGVLALMSDWFLRFRFSGQGRGGRKGQAGAILLIIGLIFLILAPLIGKIIQLAISRKREFLADASGSLLTRYPEGLARALEKIAQQGQPLKRANNATAHLYIASPFAGAKHLFSGLFSTHPPIQERVQTLRSMA